MDKESVQEVAKGAESEKSEGSMPIVNHLEEFRRRLIISLVAIGICSVFSYRFAEDLLHIIIAPAGKLYYMQPAEAFFTYLKVSLFAGFLFALPVVVYQGWRFLAPALTRTERAVVGIFIPVVVVLFFLGVAFSYFFVLPIGIQFFLGFASSDLQPLLSVGKYLDFMVMFILPFGFVFEIPLLMVILAKLGLATSAMLIQKRRLVVFGAFIAGAIVSPPDVFSQVMIAVPIILLYEISIFVIKYILKK